MIVLERPLRSCMNARIIGSGQETLILAHGYGGDQSIWDKIVPSLARRYRVVLFDWKFSGAVDDPNAFDPVRYASLSGFAKDLIALVDEMKLGSSVFVGHSLSGMVGCLASIERPHLFKKLILLGASPRYLNAEGYEGGFDEAQIEQIFMNIESNFETWAPYFASTAVDTKDSTSVEKFRKSLSRMRPEVALSMAKTIFRSDYRDCLDKVQTPSVIIQTTNDMAVPNFVAHYMQKMIKGKTTVEFIEGDGHFPQLSQSEELVAILDKVMTDHYVL